MSSTDCLACHSGDLVGARSDHTCRTEAPPLPGCVGHSTIPTQKQLGAVCPFCGDEADGDECFEDREPYDGSERKWRCSACKEKFIVTMHLSVTYSTRKT